MEKLSSAIEDTGEDMTIDESVLRRSVLYGQIQENVKWAKLPDLKQDEEEEGTSFDDALEKMTDRIEGLQLAGNMPKTKPLLYYLDFLTMEYKRIKEQIDAERDPEKLEHLKISHHRAEAKIEMTVDWLRAQDKGGDWGSMTLGDRGHEVTLPTFGNRAEVDEAIKTRHMPRHGETLEELVAGRVKRYRDDSDRISRGISVQNKHDKEEGEDADSA